MSRYILYEELDAETKSIKLLAEVVKFRHGKVACSFNLPVPSVFVFDNLDQFMSVYCNDKVRLHQIQEKELERNE